MTEDQKCQYLQKMRDEELRKECLLISIKIERCLHIIVCEFNRGVLNNEWQ